MQEHFDDEYVKKAQAMGYRSRSTFKLIEIQEKDRIIKPGMNIIDLGAAPGGWSEYASKIVGKKNKVIALDLLDIDPIEGVDFIQGDFSLMMQWCPDLKQLFSEIHRVLKNNGLILFSTFGPDTLKELKNDVLDALYKLLDGAAID